VRAPFPQVEVLGCAAGVLRPVLFAPDFRDPPESFHTLAPAGTGAESTAVVSGQRQLLWDIDAPALGTYVATFGTGKA
jgi:hypothetical protein